MKKRFLIAPLNWGLGHATRCIPIINCLLNKGAEVLIASDGASLKLLQKEFPQLIFFSLPPYDIQYPEGNNMALRMMMQLPLLWKATRNEHAALQRIISENKIDVVISDNRYGCYSNKCYSAFITHQIEIQTPQHLQWLQPLVKKINLTRINNFDECWIPDFENEPNLSGKLSHTNSLPEKNFFIGPLSRLNQLKVTNCQLPIANLLIVISGPEPQRTIFEKLIFDQLIDLKIKTTIVCGVTDKYEMKQWNDFVTVHSYLNTKKLEQLFVNADVIISRSGYSTIMDLAATGKRAILVPTPGQTEQEYLAKKFFDEKIFFTQNQNVFDLKIALREVENFSGLKMENDLSVLKKRIDEMMK